MSNSSARRLGILWLILAIVIAAILVVYFTSDKSEPQQQTMTTGASPQIPVDTVTDISTENISMEK